MVGIAFDRPQEFTGKALEIAGDALTEPQIVAAFSRALGRPVEVVPSGRLRWGTTRDKNARLV